MQVEIYVGVDDERRADPNTLLRPELPRASVADGKTFAGSPFAARLTRRRGDRRGRVAALAAGVGIPNGARELSDP